MVYQFSQYQEAADYIAKEMQAPPVLGIVLGSGLGAAFQDLDNITEIPYDDIPHFPTSTVASHAGKLLLFELYGKQILALSGRFHYYEGYEMEETVFPILVMKLLGIQSIILTNAAGAVNTSFHPGDFMVISDHIKMFTQSPVRGQVFQAFGERFFDLTYTYTPSYRALLKTVAKKHSITLQEGVYAYMPGPQFETPAEIRMLRTLGADAVGMSTVAEAIAAAGCKMKIAGISCITNMGAGIENAPISDDEVVEVANLVQKDFKTLVCEFIREV